MTTQNNLKSLNIVQWNAKSIIPRLPEISKYCDLFNVFLISETWLTPNKSFWLKGFDTVRRDRVDRRGGGVMILVYNKLKYKTIPMIFECGGKIEACAIEVFVENEPVVLVSCYRPPGADHISVQEWIQFFPQFSGKVIFGGDFNAHNEVWGSSSTCRVGGEVREALDELDLSLLNDGTPTFHSVAYHSNTVIDLSVAHDSLAMRLSWRVSDDPWGSDHLPIIMRLQAIPDLSSKTKRVPRLHNTNTDWDLFQVNLDKDIKLIGDIESMDIESLYSTFISVIEDALLSAAPSGRWARSSVSTLAFHPPPCPWWNAECDRLVRLRKAALKKFQFLGLYEDFIEYKRRTAVTKCELRKLKQENFRSFCSSLRKDTDPSFAWKTIKRFQSRFNSCDTAHAYNPDRIDRVRDQIETLCVSWAPTQPPELPPFSEDGFLDLPFSNEELSSALRGLNAKSSPGIDGIDYVIISNLTPLAKHVLLFIYNSILDKGVFPPSWRRYLIFLSLKRMGQKCVPSRSHLVCVKLWSASLTIDSLGGWNTGVNSRTHNTASVETDRVWIIF